MLLSLELRASVTRAKIAGRANWLPTSRLWRIWTKPCHQWETLEFIQPIKCEADTIVRYQTPLGDICCREGDRQSLSVLILDEVRGVYDHSPACVRQGDRVIDLGAHVGTFTRYALSRGARMVLAVEADSFHVECLRRTFAEEIAAGKVHIVHAAVWNSKKRIAFHSAGLLSRITEDGESSVETVTIDELAAAIPSVDFIKADIEGAERVALQGARLTLKTHQPRMALCTYHLPDDPVVIPQVIRDSHAGYRFAFNLSRSQVYCSV